MLFPLDCINLIIHYSEPLEIIRFSLSNKGYIYLLAMNKNRLEEYKKAHPVTISNFLSCIFSWFPKDNFIINKSEKKSEIVVNNWSEEITKSSVFLQEVLSNWLLENKHLFQKGILDSETAYYLTKKISRDTKAYYLQAKDFMIIIINFNYFDTNFYILNKGKIIYRYYRYMITFDFNSEDFINEITCDIVKDVKLQFNKTSPYNMIKLLLQSVVIKNVMIEYVKILVDKYNILWNFENDEFYLDLMEYRITVDKKNVAILKDEILVEKICVVKNNFLSNTPFENLKNYNKIKPKLNVNASLTSYQIYDIRSNANNELFLVKIPWLHNLNRESALQQANKLVLSNYLIVLVKGADINNSIVGNISNGEVLFIGKKLFDGSIYTEEKIDGQIVKKWNSSFG